MTTDLAPVQRHPAEGVARELLRTALLCKLAIDIGDPVLAGRAARRAATSARLLGGMDLPAYVDPDDDLPEVDDLLVAKYPASTDQDSP